MVVDLEEVYVPCVKEKITIDSCNYLFLPENFYQEEVNETEENMRIMAEKSKDIFLPGNLGEFIDETHYLESIGILFLSTKETRNREIFLKKFILPKLKNRERILDIGPGDGGALRMLGDEFDNVSIIDNNEKIINNIASSFKNVDETIHCDFNELPKTDKKYDLILMSHMLYYSDRNTLEELIVNVYDMLSSGGILAIIYSDGLGKENISSFFGGSLLSLEKTISRCEEIFGVRSEKYISVVSRLCAY